MLVSHLGPRWHFKLCRAGQIEVLAAATLARPFYMADELPPARPSRAAAIGT